MRFKLAIVGSHPDTRALAPFDDPSFDIWVFNEAGASTWAKRVSGLFQMHTPPVYRNPLNRTDKGHWEWLQQKHGYPIWMQETDPLVPDSVRYPIDRITQHLLGNFSYNGHPIQFYTSSIADALALAIYQDWPEIHMYGVEMASNTEYTYQRDCVTFWTGIALGRGIPVYQHCGNDIYNVPRYGYDGDIQIKPDEFLSGLDQVETQIDEAEQGARNSLEMANASIEGEDFPAKYKELLGKVREAAIVRGMANEARRYHERAQATKAPIVRQEYEINLKLAANESAKYMGMLNFDAGRAFYAWELWRASGLEKHLADYRGFSERQLEFERLVGDAEGRQMANHAYMQEMDQRIRAAGGAKAVAALEGAKI